MKFWVDFTSINYGSGGNIKSGLIWYFLVRDKKIEKKGPENTSN